MPSEKKVAKDALFDASQIAAQDSCRQPFEDVPQNRFLDLDTEAAHQWPLRVHTLGRFAIFCNGQLLEFNGKSPRKALELLQVLIAHGGREVDTAVLMRDLWQDDISGDLRNLFDNTLHRLRRLLGPVDVLNLHNAKLTLNPAHCWVDAWAFGRLSSVLIDGTGEFSGADSDQIVKEAEVALRLYSGHFLHNVTDDPWVFIYRDRLKSRFQRLVMAIGARWERAGEWESAANVYMRGLEVDNLSEAFYQQLMVCYQKTGEHAEALRVYRRCRELLSIVLGIVPSPKTERLRLASLNA